MTEDMICLRITVWDKTGEHIRKVNLIMFIEDYKGE